MARTHRRTIQKGLHDADNSDSVITHLEPDILECKVKCVLGSVTMSKASGDDGFPAELFQILKYDAVKLLHSVVAKRLEKVSFHSNPKERQCQEQSSYCTIALISQASKVMLNILQTRLKQYVN